MLDATHWRNAGVQYGLVFLGIGRVGIGANAVFVYPL